MDINVYVLDKRSRPEGYNRDWKNIVPQPFCPVVLESYDTFSPAHDDLVIVHLSDFQSPEGDGKPDPDLQQKLQSAGCLCLIISGSGSSQPQVSPNGRGYLRCTPVNYPTDTVFSSRLAIFLEHLSALSSGMNPTWRLIEPDAIPEHLFAIYLLSLATKHNQKIDFIPFTKKLDEAKVEFKALGGTNDAFLASDANSFTKIVLQKDVRDSIRFVLQSN